MTWIKTISYDESEPKLRKVYDRVKDKEGNIDNILKSHSLRPHTLVGHMTLYKNVLHHSSNTIPKWFLEALGIYVSMLNKCTYCVEHHMSGMSKLINDEERSGKIRDALEGNKLEDAFDDKHVEAFSYAEQLTLHASEISEMSIEKLRKSGWSDGEILEINQVVSYFQYANRTVLGLGVGLDGDILGTSPNDNSDPNNWHHD